MGRFETPVARCRKEPVGLTELSGQWIDRVHARVHPSGIVLDMDSSVSPTHGEQEMSVWNGHYACTCYHPLFLFNQSAIWNAARFARQRCTVGMDGEMCWSRSWRAIVARPPTSNSGPTPPSPCRAVYEYFEANGIKYAIRIPTNQILQDRIGYLLTRPVGVPRALRAPVSNMERPVTPQEANPVINPWPQALEQRRAIHGRPQRSERSQHHLF
jgi:hypothetical protein